MLLAWFERCPWSFSMQPLSRRLFIDLTRLADATVREHLQLDAPSRPELSIQAFPYESAYTELQAVCASLGPKDKVWICEKAGCALTQVIPKVGLQGRSGGHRGAYSMGMLLALLWETCGSSELVLHFIPLLLLLL